MQNLHLIKNNSMFLINRQYIYSLFEIIKKGGGEG